MEENYYLLFNSGRSKMSEEMKIVEICKYMNWNYNTYNCQPDWFIDAVFIRMQQEVKAEDRKQRKQMAQSRRKSI